MKLLDDISLYISGKKVYKLSDNNTDKYPIELSFTLKDKIKYYYPMDDNGIPMKEYKSVGITYNPTRIASYGFSNWNLYRETNSKSYLEEFKKALDWFVNNHVDGKWEYNFNWGELKAPWISGMAQGEAISILVRGFTEFKNQKYIELAIEATKPLLIDIKKGGLRSKIEQEYTFIEEYPYSKNKSHVLNGFLYTLIGLIELIDVLKEDDRRQKDYIEIKKFVCECIDSLEKNIDKWDSGYWSYYDLRNERKGFRNLCTMSYHSLHIAQLKFIAHKTKNKKLAQKLHIWEGYSENITYRLKAFFYKVIFRIKNPSQK